MVRVGIRELKARLGAYLKKVQRGTTVVITDRGKPRYLLHRLDEEDAAAEKLAFLVARGAVRPGSGRLGKAKPIQAGGPPASELISEERG